MTNRLWNLTLTRTAAMFVANHPLRVMCFITIEQVLLHFSNNLFKDDGVGILLIPTIRRTYQRFLNYIVRLQIHIAKLNDYMYFLFNDVILLTSFLRRFNNFWNFCRSKNSQSDPWEKCFKYLGLCTTAFHDNCHKLSFYE